MTSFLHEQSGGVTRPHYLGNDLVPKTTRWRSSILGTIHNFKVHIVNTNIQPLFNPTTHPPPCRYSTKNNVIEINTTKTTHKKYKMRSPSPERLQKAPISFYAPSSHIITPFVITLLGRKKKRKNVTHYPILFSISATKARIRSFSDHASGVAPKKPTNVLLTISVRIPFSPFLIAAASHFSTT